MLLSPFCPLGIFGITFVRIKKKYFLSVLLSLMFYLNWKLHLTAVFFFPQSFLWLHLLKLGV